MWLTFMLSNKNNSDLEFHSYFKNYLSSQRDSAVTDDTCMKYRGSHSGAAFMGLAGVLCSLANKSMAFAHLASPR